MTPRDIKDVHLLEQSTKEFWHTTLSNHNDAKKYEEIALNRAIN